MNLSALSDWFPQRLSGNSVLAGWNEKMSLATRNGKLFLLHGAVIISKKAAGQGLEEDGWRFPAKRAPDFDITAGTYGGGCGF